MLDKINSKQFELLVGENFSVDVDGQLFSATLDSVKEYPDARLPEAGESSATPFSLIFNTAADKAFRDGIHTIKNDKLDTVEGVFINRILSQGDSSRAWYQVVFS